MSETAWVLIGVWATVVVVAAILLLSSTIPHCTTWERVYASVPAYTEHTWNPWTQSMISYDHPAALNYVTDYCVAP